MSETSIRVRDAAPADLGPARTGARIAAVVLFAIATAVGARLSVPVPLTPVPVTLQTLFVLLSGALLGSRLGALSQITYLAAGIAGLPVFAGGAGLAYLAGPTGGYLVAFPVAAFLAGVVTDALKGRQGVLGGLALFVALFLVSLVILAGGATWLGLMTGDFAGAFALGFVPFLVGDVLKVALTTLVAWRGRDRVLRLL